MHLKILLCLIAIHCIPLKSSVGAILNSNDFQPPLGAKLTFSGLNSGIQGTIEYQFRAYSPYGENGRETTGIFTANDPSNSYTLSIRGPNASIATSTYTSSAATYTLTYTPAWSLLPPFLETGNTYNSSAAFTYSIQDINVTGSVNASVTVVGIETLQTALGTFEALKVQANMLLTESWSSGWAQTTQAQTVWYGRQIGPIKQVISSVTTYSSGERIPADTDLVITQSNVDLANQPVLPTAFWGKYPIIENDFVDTGPWFGYLEISKAPWVYSYSLGRFLYIPNDTAQIGSGWLYSP